ncbi:Tbingi protein [Trypanosoma grayi]|uniref:Tbingi protein n=1 Tax=Trypanosoma grayi TaxID=71804 RepID=UPI0004F47BEB|nr:Tbingi protein [Trypanosoma grayi]KEG07635.1 Tbingi protein [Trypanosoma grayi]
MTQPDRVLRLLPPGSAPQPDMTHGEALRHLGKGANHSALTLFNKSLRTGIVPQSWRHGIISPLLKLGKKATGLEPYRPVALTSCFCELIGRIIAARILDVILPALTPQQLGFRPARPPPIRPTIAPSSERASPAF